MIETAQKIIAAARNVAEGNPTLGKLIREGKDPMVKKTHYEYAAVLRTLAEELGYNNFNIDGDHGINVVNVKDILKLVEVLEDL
jgi:hypothetical protein